MIRQFKGFLVVLRGSCHDQRTLGNLHLIGQSVEYIHHMIEESSSEITDVSHGPTAEVGSCATP